MFVNKTAKRIEQNSSYQIVWSDVYRYHIEYDRLDTITYLESDITRYCYIVVISEGRESKQKE